jgi:DNA-binding transcriptional ArsR family regulator
MSKSMANFDLPSPLWELIAERFKALAEPVRLQILYALQQGERTVSELTDVTGLGQANTSKHLQILHAHGFVARRKHGLYVYYSLADGDVTRLCDIMCDRLEGGDTFPPEVPQE